MRTIRTDRKRRARHSLPLFYKALVPALALAALLAQPQAARAQTSTLSNGLVAHWRLDELSGARFDAVGDNNLSDNNGAGQADGKLGKAAEFTAAGGRYLSKADNADLSIAGDVDFTFAGWFKLSSKSSYMGLFGKDDAAGAREYTLYYDQPMDRLVWMVFASNDSANQLIASSFGSPPLNTWVFVVVWHDKAANTINVQVNNGPVNSKAQAADGVKDSVSDFKLGRGLAGTGFDGQIDSFSFWKRVLTQDERAELYNGGDGKEPVAPPPPPTEWVVSGTKIHYTAGNVGVGAGMTDPQRALDVKGDAKASGNLEVMGTITGGVIEAKFQDVAEWVPSSQRLAAGTVVVLDPDRNNQVLASTRAYDTRVAGVVSAQPGIALGERGEGKALVATTGRVRVRVDARRAPIKVGDLLVTGVLEGAAMKSAPVRVGGVRMHRPGTIVGKALEPLAGGVGEILVLLSLQ